MAAAHCHCLSLIEVDEREYPDYPSKKEKEMDAAHKYRQLQCLRKTGMCTAGKAYSGTMGKCQVKGAVAGRHVCWHAGPSTARCAVQAAGLNTNVAPCVCVTNFSAW